VPRVDFKELKAEERGESSKEIKSRIDLVRKIQSTRYHGNKRMGAGLTNSQISSSELSVYCPLSAENEQLLERVMEKYDLSARAYVRLMRVSRTIADLAGAENIEKQHLMEAVQYRSL